MTIYLDTHVAAFIHSGKPELLSPTAVHLLEAATETLLSPMAVLELQYLYEVGRIRYSGSQIAEFLQTQLAIAVDTQSLGDAVLHAVHVDWTRDPFDRVITAQAGRAGAPLLTRDQNIHDHFPDAVW